MEQFLNIAVWILMAFLMINASIMWFQSSDTFTDYGLGGTNVQAQNIVDIDALEQGEQESASLARYTVDAHATTEFFDDTTDDGKPQSCPPWFGCKKRVKNRFQCFSGHPAAAISDFYTDKFVF